MDTIQVEVSARVVGEPKASPSMGSVWLVLPAEQITVRQLIARTVEAQVEELLERRGLDQQAARRILDRHYMRLEEIEDQIEASGSVRFPSVRQAANLDRETLLPEEIRRATEALEEGRIILLIDGERVETLNQELTLTPATSIRFLRLMPLVGG